LPLSSLTKAALVVVLADAAAPAAAALCLCSCFRARAFCFRWFIKGSRANRPASQSFGLGIKAGWSWIRTVLVGSCPAFCFFVIASMTMGSTRRSRSPRPFSSQPSTTQLYGQSERAHPRRSTKSPISPIPFSVLGIKHARTHQSSVAPSDTSALLF